MPPKRADLGSFERFFHFRSKFLPGIGFFTVRTLCETGGKDLKKWDPEEMEIVWHLNGFKRTCQIAIRATNIWQVGRFFFSRSGTKKQDHYWKIYSKLHNY